MKSSSTKITCAPDTAAVIADIIPDGPAPITKISQNANAFSCLELSATGESWPNPAAWRIIGSYNFSQKLFGHIKVL